MLSRMIFALGTGRCGTYTAFRILEAQKDVAASHEGFPLPWKRDLPMLWYLFVNAQARCEAKILANSSFVWLNYTGAIMGHIPDPKFICLKRPREQVVNSFCKHTPNLNHWTDPESLHWDPNQDTHAVTAAKWPKYDLPKAEAIGAYWDEYYAKAEYLQSRYPGNFRIYNMLDVLNTEAGQRDMLSFAGFAEKDQRLYLNRKLNALGKPKGHLNPEDDYVYPKPIILEGAQTPGP